MLSLRNSNKPQFQYDIKEISKLVTIEVTNISFNNKILWKLKLSNLLRSGITF